MMSASFKHPAVQRSSKKFRDNGLVSELVYIAGIMGW
jgi:hypothetical protein